MEAGQEIAVPRAEFISDVGALVGDKPIEPLLQELQERYSQYKLVETQCTQRKQRLIAKQPEIEKALAIVKLLLEKQDAGDEVLADYELADNVFAKARLQAVASVNLWLGAKVMVEYPLEEAHEVLETQLSNCRTNIKTQSSNLDLLRENVITTEVPLRARPAPLAPAGCSTRWLPPCSSRCRRHGALTPSTPWPPTDAAPARDRCAWRGCSTMTWSGGARPRRPGRARSSAALRRRVAGRREAGKQQSGGGKGL
jgi:prefoldin subunit 5